MARLGGCTRRRARYFAGETWPHGSDMSNANLNFTREDVTSMLSAVHDLIDETARIYNRYNNEPAPDSLASQEQSSFADPGLVKDVHARGMLSIESAADHLMVFADSLAEPVKTVAPWTCVRGLLESCALAAWFLDPSVDARTRVGRCFAFRYAGFVQQIKFFKAENIQPGIDKAQRRMLKVEQDAAALGYPQLANKKGDISGIAQPMPSITDLIEATLRHEAAYRLLSGVAHGHHWATQQVGFRTVGVKTAGGHVTTALEKYLHPNFVLYVANIAVTSFVKVLWYLWRLYGWDLKEVEHLLDAIYDRLRYRAALRFWRANSSNP